MDCLYTTTAFCKTLSNSHNYSYNIFWHGTCFIKINVSIAVNSVLYLSSFWHVVKTQDKKGRVKWPDQLATLGERANKVSVRLAGLENEYWPLNHTSTLSFLLVGVLLVNAVTIHMLSLALTNNHPFLFSRVASHLLPSLIFFKLLTSQ